MGGLTRLLRFIGLLLCGLLPFSAAPRRDASSSESVAILKRNPDVAVGIHLTLNSEWKNYRWGPVLGRSAVPTLVEV